MSQNKHTISDSSNMAQNKQLSTIMGSGVNTIDLAHMYDKVSDTQYNSAIFLLGKAAVFKIKCAGDNADALNSQIEGLVGEDGFVDADQLLTLLKTIRVFEGMRVLDAGCGTGRLAEQLAKLVGPNGFVTGVDLEEASISVAQEKAIPNSRFEVGNIEDLSALRSSKYDLIVSSAVIHFLRRKQHAFCEFERLLKWDGILAAKMGSGDHSYLPADIRREVLSGPHYHGHVDPEVGAPKYPKKAEIKGFLDAAQLQQNDIFLHSGSMLMKDAEAPITFMDASTAGQYLTAILNTRREDAKKEMVAKYEALSTKEGVRIPVVRLMVTAIKTKPSPSN